MNIQEQEDRDYEDGCAYTQWLLDRRESLSAAPVRGEQGWSEELEAERAAIEQRINGY